MPEIKFTKEHEWISLEGDTATIGITAHAAEQLGDVVFVEVPEVGRKVAAGEACAVVESVKAASDVYAPVSGIVVAVNDELAGRPAAVNEAPESTGWFFKLKLANAGELSGLMDRAAYDRHVKDSA
ncbi:MAG: glycine cleavage system protein GcvH [Hyphomicrobiaceae bacterium]|nr:glycine cleavage system protein GcvH [Hyphomicrobiaceae bacterium]